MPFDADRRQNDDDGVFARTARPYIPRRPQAVWKVDDRAHVASLDILGESCDAYLTSPGQPIL